MKNIFAPLFIVLISTTWSFAQADCTLGTTDGSTCTFGTATDSDEKIIQLTDLLSGQYYLQLIQKNGIRLTQQFLKTY